MQLLGFILDLSPIIELLEKLKDDPNEYVRRSVANNLIKIAKDHPDLVTDTAERSNKDANTNHTEFIRRTCQIRLKQSNRKH